MPRVVPNRLLASIYIAPHPQDSWFITAAINGSRIAVRRAYNSRGLTRGGCFL